MTSQWSSVAVIALLLIAILCVVWIVFIGPERGGDGRGGRHAKRPGTPPPAERPHRKRVAIIVNPTKIDDLDEIRHLLGRAAERLEWAEPIFIETTESDPGRGQTREALAMGVDVVCALGGDGTVRVVGQALVGTGVPMGLLPAGTGNLLARNLLVPASDLSHALEVALTGTDRPLDVGWVVLDPTTEQLGDLASAAVAAENGSHEHRPWHRPDLAARAARNARVAQAKARERVFDHPEVEPLPADEVPHSALDIEHEPPPENAHAFLVMAGMGLDATVMDETSEELKAKVGWSAYVASGLRRLRGQRFSLHIAADGAAPVPLKAHSILVGNCGELTGGLALMPDAAPDDGVLDVVAVTPKGVAGWASVAAHVITRRSTDHRRLARTRCRNVLITVEEPQKLEVDGDVVGEARQFLAELAPRSLVVRVGTASPTAREEIAPDRLGDEATQAETADALSDVADQAAGPPHGQHPGSGGGAARGGDAAGADEPDPDSTTLIPRIRKQD